MSPDCRLTVTVRPAEAADEIAAALELRERVFCDEQGVDRSEEVDEFERSSTQVVALDETGVVATCRLRWVGDRLKLERMVVERRLRGHGVGSRLLSGAEELARARGAERIFLHAQNQARGFYAASGYEPEGKLFLEADIEHVRMSKALGSRPAAGV